MTVQPQTLSSLPQPAVVPDDASPGRRACNVVPLLGKRAKNALGSRLQGIRSPAIVNIAAVCKRMGGIDLATGIPSTPADLAAVYGAAEALRSGENAYSHPHGVPALRQAIADKLRRQNHLHCDPDSELLVTSGVIGAFSASLMALFSPGDEIIVPEPYFGWHVNLIRLAGLKPRFVRLESPSFELSGEALCAALSPRTRGIVLCTPANPTGKVYSRDELQLIADIAREHHLVVVTDEQYEHVCYDETQHISPASVDDLGERTVTIMGFSKSLSVTGWRIGYAVAPAALMEPIRCVHLLLYVCPATPLQHGVARALQSFCDRPLDSAEQLRDEMQAKRDLLCSALIEAGFIVSPPQGGFFVLAELPADAATDSSDLAMDLLERIGVASVPGRDFSSDDSGSRFLRFCFAKSDSEIEQGCRRLRALRGSL